MDEVIVIPNEETNSLKECFERLKKGCETLSEECNYSEDYSKFNPPATEEQIKEYEREFKFPLPEAYREFLKFSNGARIMGEDIYGLDMIGLDDPFVPDGYLAISQLESTSERMAISENDGEIYLCWDLKPSSWSFDREIKSLLNECEDIIDEHNREIEKEERRKAGITPEQEYEMILERIKAAKKKIAEKRKVNYKQR